MTYLAEGLNRFFTLFFSVEAIVKIVGYGKFYFRDNWNIFDFLIALASGFFTIFEVFSG